MGERQPRKESALLSRRDVLRSVAAAALIVAVPGCDKNPEAKDTGQHERHPEHTVIATVFWVGEKPSPENDEISNEETAWDPKPAERFGGEDKPGRAFQPKHNSFYCALPADEYDDDGNLIPGARERSLWANEIASLAEDESLFKGRWVQIRRGKQVAYAQWLDTGPNESQDYDYVFGETSTKPKNTFGLKAGIDLSPDAAKAFGFGLAEGGATVTWRFVDEKDVPDGPWRTYPPIDNKNYWMHS